MPSTLESSFAVLGQEVPLGLVDKALKELWGADNAMTRASLLNFAIYSEDPDSLNANTKLLEELTREHACRALLILALPKADKPQARAWITAHCQLHDGHKSVCSEQLSFLLEGGGANQLRNIVFAHLDSDLPLALWWQGEFSANFDERLYSVVDVLFMDSASWKMPAVQFEKLDVAQTGKSSRFRAYDLSWLRSHFFRTALATCFHDQPALAELSQLHRIEITHSKGHRVTALLIAAWIGVRLKCHLDAGLSGLRFTLPEGNVSEIAIVEGEGDDPLQSIVLQSDLATFRVSRDCGAAYICTHVELNGHVIEEMLPADLPDDAALIADQLSRLGGQSLYIQMVPMLREMLQA